MIWRFSSHKSTIIKIWRTEVFVFWKFLSTRISEIFHAGDIVFWKFSICRFKPYNQLILPKKQQKLTKNNLLQIVPPKNLEKSPYTSESSQAAFTVLSTVEIN